MHASPRRVVVIGASQSRTFAPLTAFLARHASVHAAFPDIESALSKEATLSAADLTVVMQSWTDEFNAAEVNRLIGQTLFHRLLCCYSVACESDGRNREIWPDAVRVPLRLAASIVERELRDAGTENDPIPPTAARDEVFSHRLGQSKDWQPLPGLAEMNGAVVSPDRALRQTMKLALKNLGLKCLDLPPLVVNGMHRIRSKETSRGPVHLLIHDLDPWSPLVEDSVQTARRMFPSAVIFGLATMPDAGLAIEVADQNFVGVIPKLDIEHGLRWHLRQLLSHSTNQEAGRPVSQFQNS